MASVADTKESGVAGEGNSVQGPFSLLALITTDELHCQSYDKQAHGSQEQRPQKAYLLVIGPGT
jgi:hypothetical protein